MKRLKDFFLATSAVSPKQAYEYGRDCALNGANKTNCHFSIFSSKANTAAWEKGKAEALSAKED